MLEKVNDFLEYNRSEIFAGGDGRFNGTFKGQPVVVIQTSLSSIETITSVEDLLRIMHPNVALLLDVTADNDFRYDAIEKYAASLDSRFFENSNLNKYSGPMPSNEQVLLQLANGLGYLHSLNILHGDIKPENILISSTKPVQMKWTGFGFRQSNDSYSLSKSGLQLGSRKWWPPEMYEDGKKASKAGEIFSAGCVFLYFLSGGFHPFGSRSAGGLAAESEIEINVKIGRVVKLIGPNDSDLSISDFAFLINMIEKNPDERITLWNVIRRLKIKQLQDSKNCPLLQHLERGRMRKRKIDSNEKYSFGLHLSKLDGVVVKKISKKECCSAVDIGKLSKLDHWNIVRIFDYYEDSSYRYFRMEFCSASLDHLFFPEEDPKYNIDSMPSLDQVFLQIVNGLQYIHENGLVHCSIKPSNVLINSNENPQIKLADFGLIEPRWDHMISSSSAVSVSNGFQSEHYWLAPELLNAANRGDSVKPTKESDIFATGKVFFYYYYQFLIQKLKTISDGTREPNFKKLSKSPIKLIKNMTKEDQKSRWELSEVISNVVSSLKKEIPKLGLQDSKLGAIQYLRNHILGFGQYGIVFLGFWKGSIAVVKRIERKTNRKIMFQREKQLQGLIHDNVVKFYSSESDLNFRYIAMEKCSTSLEDYCRQPQLFHGVIPMPSDKEVLLQMAKGLQYIHSQELIHRDVKPGNILISGDDPAVIKWTDFGVSKMVKNKDGEPWTCRQGTQGWMAPEVLLLSDNKSLIAGEKSDIFSLGCVFFFFLTPALHPFGTFQERDSNILKSQIEPIPAQLIARNHPAFAQILLGMIEYDKNLRTNLSDVLKKLYSVVI